MSNNETVEQIIKVMKFHLSNFNNKGIEITNKTLHSEVLDPTIGFESSNPMVVYKAVVRWTIRTNFSSKKTWPKDWMN